MIHMIDVSVKKTNEYIVSHMNLLEAKTIVLYIDGHGCDTLQSLRTSLQKTDFYKVIHPMIIYESPGHSCLNISSKEIKDIYLLG